MGKDMKLWAFLVVFLGPLGIAITFLAKNHTDKYVVFYMKQILTLGIIVGAAGIVNIIPLLGQLLYMLVGLAALVLWIIGWIYALQGEEKEIPLVGQYAKQLFAGFKG